MKKDILQVSVYVDDNKASSSRTGYVTVQVAETITVNKIEGAVFLEARGSMRGTKKEITQFFLSNTTTLTKLETYKFPFSFELGDKLDSYAGTNANLSYNCEISFEIAKNDVAKFDRSAFSKFISFVANSDYSVSFSKYFDYISEGNYQVKEDKLKFNLQPNIAMSVLSATVIIATYLYYRPEFQFWHIIAGAFATAILIGISILIANKLLGHISLQLYDEKTGFRCVIQKPLNANISTKKIHYEILEEVIDKRGTSSTTYTTKLYTAPKKQLDDFKKSITFEYPTKKGLQSFEYGDIEVLWKMILKINYYGLAFTYNCKIEVPKSPH